MRFRPVLCGAILLGVGCSGVTAAESPQSESAVSQSTGSAPATTPTPAGAANVMPTSAHADSSRTSLDWDGRYLGRLPCADCEAIETELTLSPDGTYVLKTRYLGRSEHWERETGHFVWDERGQVVRLNEGAADAKAYFVGENILWQLDASGQRIQGNLAQAYQLHKVPPEAGDRAREDSGQTLFGQPWRLTVLNGQPVADLERPISLELVESEGRVQGFSGCNRFFGEVRLDWPAANETGTVPLKFSQMGMTRMACLDDTHETPFMQALQETRAMRLNGSELILLDASGQALAFSRRMPASGCPESQANLGSFVTFFLAGHAAHQAEAAATASTPASEPPARLAARRRGTG